MHAVAEIVIPPNRDIAESVKQIMEYFFDEDDKGNKTDHADWWDFYVIGGRFSGHKLEASLGEEKLQAFREELIRRKVTVSCLQCGKQELNPASQIPMVDALWLEMFPGKGEACPLFAHARNQYGKRGIYADDVCKVSEIPGSLTAERIIVAGPHWEDPARIIPVRMWATEWWNHVEHQKTAWDGNVKAALAAMRAETGYRKVQVTDEWVVVTVDYHN